MTGDVMQSSTVQESLGCCVQPSGGSLFTPGTALGGGSGPVGTLSGSAGVCHQLTALQGDSDFDKRYVRHCRISPHPLG